MSEIHTLDGAMLAKLLKNGAARLNSKRTVVNELNVFPVPDGDTGDNMFMTIDSGAGAVQDCTQDPVDVVSAKAARQMLLGARGNSGVILSRIFSGIARGFAGVEKADAAAVAKALETGIEEAYSAVSHPVEGTMLTVYREAVRYAAGRHRENDDLAAFGEDFLQELRRSLERTPELLSVLKDAGVVDSGGAGLLYIAEGICLALQGDEEPLNGTPVPGESPKAPDLSAFNEDSVLDYGYCTEFLLQLQRSKVDIDTFDAGVIFDWLKENGESVVCFREGNIIKAHIHTMHPGDVLNHCQRYGEFLTLKVENMTLQHNETTVRNGYSEEEPQMKTRPHKDYGTVVVASGSGIRRTFSELGADEVIEGGQSMNPSAQDFVKAFEQIDADTILVFPNNSNIIMTASQAAGLYTKAKICVVPTRTIGEGYAALSMLDTSSGNTDEILEQLKEIISGVVTGMVSAATRDTVMDGVQVVKGDHIGFTGRQILSCAPGACATAEALCDKLDAASFDVVLVIRGESAGEEETARMLEELQKKYRRTEFIPIDGMQPVYDYILIFE
ncbi:MAG: hypothetical protein CW338_07120 [Clostridiales bacterium]|nr:hypothetical protein [Clostridiales bacterium]